MAIHLRTPQTEAVRLRRVWIAQYGRANPQCVTILNSLPDSATPEEVDALFASLPFGSTNRVQRVWECDECGGADHQIMAIDLQANDDKPGVFLCLKCVKRMFYILS